MLFQPEIKNCIKIKTTISRKRLSLTDMLLRANEGKRGNLAEKIVAIQFCHRQNTTLQGVVMHCFL